MGILFSEKREELGEYYVLLYTRILNLCLFVLYRNFVREYRKFLQKKHYKIHKKHLSVRFCGIKNICGFSCAPKKLSLNRKDVPRK